MLSNLNFQSLAAPAAPTSSFQAAPQPAQAPQLRNLMQSFHTPAQPMSFGSPSLSVPSVSPRSGVVGGGRGLARLGSIGGGGRMSLLS